MSRFCTNCGNEISDGMAFCTECGTKAPEQVSAPQPTNEAKTVAETPQSQQQAQPQSTPQTQPTQPAQPVQPAQQPAQPAQPAPQMQYAPPAPQMQYAQPAPQVQYAPPASQMQYAQPVQPVYAPQQTAQTDDKRSDTVGTAYYFFMQLLFSIPIIGFFACIISACSGNNKSKKNFSRAYLIWLIIGIVLSIVSVIALISIGKSLVEYINSQLGGEYGNMGELIGQFNEIN